MVFWLHTARTESPDTPQTHPSASEFHDYHSDTPKHPPDIPKAPPRYLQGTQHSNRRQQTPPDTPKHWEALFEYVWRCQLASVVVCLHVLFNGDVWGVSVGYLGGVRGYLSGIHGNQRRLDVFGGYLGSQSLQYGAKTPFWHSPKYHNFCSPDHTETSKYQNRRISAFQKWLGYAIFLIFWVRQRKIICYSCFWSPCRPIPRAREWVQLVRMSLQTTQLSSGHSSHVGA